MAALLLWVNTGHVSPTAGRDNLQTLQLVEMLYRSADTHQSQLTGEDDKALAVAPAGQELHLNGREPPDEDPWSQPAARAIVPRWG